MPVLKRAEYAALVDMIERDTFGKPQAQLAMQCIAEYRIICHHLAPLLHDAIADSDDPQELAHLRDILKQLQRGE